MTKENYELLLEMGCKLHPHLKEDNHTNRLISSLYNNDKLTPSDCFDLGKYYDRMFQFVDENPQYIHALIDLKSDVYSPSNHNKTPNMKTYQVSYDTTQLTIVLEEDINIKDYLLANADISCKGLIMDENNDLIKDWGDGYKEKCNITDITDKKGIIVCEVY